MNETLHNSENQSNYPELESDFAMKDAMAEGEFGPLLDLRKESFDSAIAEHRLRLVEYLDQFMAVNQDSVFESASLDSFDESGLDMTRLSTLVSNLHTAQQAYLNYIVDLEVFVSSSYPEQSLLIMSLMEFSVALGNRTLLGGDLSREYPNLHHFINSNVEAFLSPEQRMEMHKSTSRVARIDLQMNLNELIDIKIDSILGETFRGIEWRGNYLYGGPFGHEITEDDFVNSDLGQDLRVLLLSQLQQGYECEPVVSMVDDLVRKGLIIGIPFKRYQISFKVTKGSETFTTPTIDASNYYHPYIHGPLKGDMDIKILQRMSNVDMDYQASLAEASNEGGDERDDDGESQEKAGSELPFEIDPDFDPDSIDRLSDLESEEILDFMNQFMIRPEMSESHSHLFEEFNSLPEDVKEEIARIRNSRGY